MKVKYLITILLIVLFFSLISCSAPKTVTQETVAKTIIETAETTTSDTVTTTTAVPETTITEEPNFASFDVKEYDNLTITFKSCLESNIAVEGEFINGTFTCTAKPGLKFEILFFEFKNNGNITQETPSIGFALLGDKDFLITDTGDSYPVWELGVKHNEKEYNRRESTPEEINKFLGDAGGIENLPPEASVKGCIIFEIPNTEIPVEAKLTIGDNIYDVEIPEEFIIQDINLQETTSSTTDYESVVRDIIKKYIDETLEGQLTKFILEEDSIFISYNSKWASEDTIKKEMFNVVSIFSGSDYPDLYEIVLTSTGNLSGDSYKSINSKEILLKLHDYKMDYPEWLEETF